MRTFSLSLLLAIFTAPPALAVTIFFDGAEPGISNGGTSFSFIGSNWQGGTVRVVGDPAIYHSGSFAYMMNPANQSDPLLQVLFDVPVMDLSFAFMHGGIFSNVPAATAEAFDAGGSSLGSVSSLAGLGMATPLVSFSSAVPIERIEFTGGVVDTFSYSPVPEPSTALLTLAGMGALSLRRRFETAMQF